MRRIKAEAAAEVTCRVAVRRGAILSLAAQIFCKRGCGSGRHLYRSSSVPSPGRVMIVQREARSSGEDRRAAADAAPLAQALSAACTRFGAAPSVSLQFLPRLRKAGDCPVCLFDVCTGSITVSGASPHLAEEDAPRLLRSLLGDGFPVRKLLVPESLAD